ncbi:type VI secretion system protein TssL, short form [Pseudomonas sp. Pseusp3]|uniref:type VI secretion system protein TssL, short form n=1 Tax=unclassified Pseudomonas TaxID=196821 RepID=UPI0039B017CD
MKPTLSKLPAVAAVDVDTLLQDSYLLVVELLHGTPVHGSQDISALCIKQIEHVLGQLEQAGLSRRSIDHISHAQCALLDETVLGFAKGEDHAKWANEPLQARFFNRHQAGEFLYEDMREVLRDPAPDLHVLTAFHRVLMLGFKGRYQQLDDPEREQLLAALSARVQPLKLGQSIDTQFNPGTRGITPAWLRTPLAQGLAAGVLLAAVWCGLDYLLGDLIATLVPGRV